MSPNKPNDLLSVINDEFGFERGHPLPLGVTVSRGGINFAIFGRHATTVTLVLFLPGREEPIAAFPFHPRHNRTGDVWHAFLAGMNPGIEYAYRIDGPHSPRERFDPRNLLSDPYALAMNGRRIWGDRRTEPADLLHRALIVDSEFDWELDQPINRPLADSVIYELNVRSFTRDASAKVDAPGTFRGLIEKIPYLSDLGVTAVELLPVTEFDELDNDRVNPENGAPLRNLWGYHPVSFFSVKAGYASSSTPGSEVREFKELIKALHTAGIEVILDVVYNHTGEGDQRGPSYSFKGIDNSTYYMLTGDGSYMNFSGCGNTLNCNHPFVRHFIVDSLRYWVTEMHVDGFRFDLAAILGRDQNGHVLSSPPLLEQIAGDPVLANTKLIAEAWDAAGLYQVGRFPNWGRWAEWNGCFRDDIRRFVRGDPGMVPNLATRLAGSSDLFQSSRAPGHGINFVTIHDGFTLADLVSYNDKHNLANGEGNRDGESQNLSWNCGIEGPTEDLSIRELRGRQVRNLVTLLLLSRGVPMFMAGDEMGRTQEGNNNAYCQDNPISWLDWEQFNANKGLHRFFKRLIAFRKTSALLRFDAFTLNEGLGPRIDWHGFQLGAPDWSAESRSLAMHLYGNLEGGAAPEIYLMANAHWETHDFALPASEQGRWHRLVDTALPGEDAISDPGDLEPLLFPHHYLVQERSVVVLVSNPTGVQIP